MWIARIFILFLLLLTKLNADEADRLVLYKGRIRPFESYSKNYLYSLYHHYSIDAQDLINTDLPDGKATTFTSKLHSEGASFLENAPILYLPTPSLQKLAKAKKVSPNQAKLLLTQPLSKEDAAQLNEKLSLLNHPPGLFQKDFPRGLPLPSKGQIKAENLYHALPLTAGAIIAFLLSLPLLMIPFTVRAGFLFFLLALCLMTCNLGLRWYILARPPVANMGETLLYVPWAAAIASLALSLSLKKTFPLFASALLAVILLSVLELTANALSLDTVQPVLNSPLWLTVHVLMIVASYGILLLSGVLGHLYLLLYPRGQNLLFHSLLYAMYGGLSLLIPGTLLGGVWAAQSWGRFWDWDPKESWAFITCCIYLLIIHAYRMKKIGPHAVAIGSIFGLIAVSFTWYGVNYILGTGLHSYGFGNGGELYYYGFLTLEFLFVAVNLLRFKREIGISS